MGDSPSSRKILTPTRRGRNVSLKLEIAEFAARTSVKQASKTFSCDRKSVKLYLAQKRKLEELCQTPGWYRYFNKMHISIKNKKLLSTKATR